MALILVTGFPCVGKTSFCGNLKKALCEKFPSKRVCVVGEELLHILKSSSYGESSLEKSTRGSLKSAVERELNMDTIVIADSLNYIKGYRYELYCIARSQRVVSCCVYVEADDNSSNTWNAARTDDKYPDEM